MTAYTTPQLAPFTLDPSLSWLSTDPAMQRHEAFVGMETIALNSEGWAPMSRHFPGGTVLAMVRITKMEELVEGGLYWHQTKHESTVIDYFGRFEGFAYPTTVAKACKQQRAHIILSTDVLDCNLRAAWLQQDGTATHHINFGASACHTQTKYSLWRITHYVTMPAPALAMLGPEAEAAAGLTINQKRWLDEEKALLTVEHCCEYSARILGGFPEADCRAILQGQRKMDFARVAHGLPTITPSQAKKRKSGAVAITWRSYDYTGLPISYTDHYKREDADLLLGLLQNLTDLERAEARVRANWNALAFAANAVRDAERVEEIAQEAVAAPRRELAEAA